MENIQALYKSMTVKDQETSIAEHMPIKPASGRFQMPLFIVVEGIDYSGKSSVAKAIKDQLEKQGDKVIVLSNPGGNDELEFSQGIRKLFKSATPRTRDVDVLLLAADRLYLAYIAKEYLSKGYHVIMDRWDISAHAYQGGHEITAKLTDGLYNKLIPEQDAIKGLPKPDVLIWLDVSERIAYQRMIDRRNNEEKQGTSHDLPEVDRYEPGNDEEFSEWYHTMRDDYAILVGSNVVTGLGGFYAREYWDGISQHLEVQQPIDEEKGPMHHTVTDEVSTIAPVTKPEAYYGVDFAPTRFKEYEYVIRYPVDSNQVNPKEIANYLYLHCLNWYGTTEEKVSMDAVIDLKEQPYVKGRCEELEKASIERLNWHEAKQKALSEQLEKTHKIEALTADYSE